MAGVVRVVTVHLECSQEELEVTGNFRVELEKDRTFLGGLLTRFVNSPELRVFAETFGTGLATTMGTIAQLTGRLSESDSESGATGKSTGKPLA